MSYQEEGRDSWSRVAIPVLQGVLEAERSGNEVWIDDLRKRVSETSEPEFHNVLSNLVDAGYLAGQPVPEGGRRYPEYLDLRILPRGRREVDDWPS